MNNPWMASWAGRGRVLAGLLLVAALSGCASVFVDAGTREVAASDYRKPEQVQPVQLLFEFQTQGVPSAQATGHLKARIADQVRASGLFSEVGDGPVKGGASLSIVLNNVPLTDNTFAKGFMTGLTLGLAGTEVGEGYVCTATFRPSADAPPVVKKARHAIYTTLGAKGRPANSVKVDNLADAVYQMTRQIVSNVLNEVSRDPVFK